MLGTDTTFLNRIGREQMLTHDDLCGLFTVVEKSKTLIRKHDQDPQKPLRSEDAATLANGLEAVQKLIMANMKLVVSIVRKFPRKPTIEESDLIQEGVLGLRQAILNYDWHKGFRFSTYATFSIKQAVARAMDGKAPLIRIPEPKMQQLRHALDSTIEPSQMDDRLQRLYHVSRVSSLDVKLLHANGESSSATYADLLTGTLAQPEDEMLSSCLVDGLLQDLEPTAQRALRLRFGLEDGTTHSFKAIAAKLAVSHKKANELVSASLEQVRSQHADDLVSAD